ARPPRGSSNRRKPCWRGVRAPSTIDPRIRVEPFVGLDVPGGALVLSIPWSAPLKSAQAPRPGAATYPLVSLWEQRNMPRIRGLVEFIPGLCLLLGRVSLAAAGARAQEDVIVEVGDEWRYLKGTEAPPADWTALAFDD